MITHEVIERRRAPWRPTDISRTVLYLPLYNSMLFGDSFISRDAYGHVCTNYQTLWTPQGRDFDGINDYIELNDGVGTSPLNFTSGDFSLVARLKVDSLAAHTIWYCRGLEGADGWDFYIQSTGALYVKTNQVGVGQASYSSAGVIVTGTWYTVGTSRVGASMRMYRNGVDVTSVMGNHIDPVTCARTTKIGVYDNKTTFPFKGKIEFLAVFNRALSPMEHQSIHNALNWRK